MNYKNYLNIRLELWVSKNAEPLILHLKDHSPTIDLCYQLLSLYNYPPTTEIVLKNFKTGREELNLSEIEKVNSRFNNKFLISFIPLDLHVDIFYRLLTNENSFSIGPVTGETYKSVLSYQFDSMNNYSAHIFRHQLLYIAIRDIVNGQPTMFSKCLPSYFLEMDDQLHAIFSPEIITNVFVEILSTLFADKYEWITLDSETKKPSLPHLSSDFSDAMNFSKFIVDLIEKGCNMKQILKKSFSPFKPAQFVVDFITIITDELLNRFDNPTVSQIVNDIFGCNWLYKAFQNQSKIDTFLNHKNFYDLYPALVLRSKFYRFLQEELTQFDIDAIFMTYDQGSPIWVDEKNSKSVYESMFESIYEIIEAEDSPCLVLSKAKHDSIMVVLRKSNSIIKSYFEPYSCTQKQFLISLTKHLTKYNFEPKGLCFIIVDFFIKVNFLKETLLNTWVQHIPDSSPFKESLLIELNTLIISPIAKPFFDQDSLIF
ncbi:hypothetical protein M9Y10_041332 [Tritrichomonas musculus]|uniref:Uncharacterized protein n=1 Tax=Tritrichomonas musculus TaxID=1915356 RepID=A0ABR2K740_9EUKA